MTRTLLFRLPAVAVGLLVVAGAIAAASAASRKNHAQKRNPSTPAPSAETAVSLLHPWVTFGGAEVVLPQSHVPAMVQDGRGFMWFGTSGGLVRYDGRQSKVYKPDPHNDATLPSVYITALALDPSKRLWIGTDDAGLALYDPDTDTFVRFKHDAADRASLASDNVSVLSVDARGTLLVGMNDGSVDAVTPGDRKIAHLIVRDETDSGVNALAEGPDGALWLGTDDKGLYKYDPATKETSKAAIAAEEIDLHKAKITTLRFDKSGVLWAGTDSGLVKIEPSGAKAVVYRHGDKPSTLADDHIYSLLEDRAGRFWVGTEAGLHTLDRARHEFTRYVFDGSQPETATYPKDVRSIYQEQGGVIWFGTFAKGLRKIDELRLRMGLFTRGNVNFTAFSEDQSGALWAGTYEDGLYKFDRGSRAVTVYRSIAGPTETIPLKSFWITSLLHDRRGTLWIARTDHLIAFDEHQGITEVYKHTGGSDDVLGAESIGKILEDDEGAIWLATWGAGLARLDRKTKKLEHFRQSEKDPASLSDDRVFTAALDRKDRDILWVGTNQGLNRFNMIQHKAVQFRAEADDANAAVQNQVQSIFQSADGILWLGTNGGGLLRFDPATSKFDRFGSADGLPNETIYGVLGDDDGNVWLSTNGGGLVMFEPKTKVFRTFDAADGIQSSEFAQFSAYRSAKGDFYFGGLWGFNAFTPRDLARDEAVPTPTFTHFKVFAEEKKLDAPVWTTPKIDLSFRESRFSIEFAALTFGSPQRIQYRYKLEGNDDDWNPAPLGDAQYTNVSGGDYTLKVQAANRAGVWSEPASLLIHVDAPPYRRWWAYTLYLLILGGGALAFVRYQNQRLQEVNRAHRLASVERDLDLTRAVQMGFLPTSNYVGAPNLHLFGLYRAADVCSGDWWWHESNGQDRFVVVVGDVTGHGPGPAMVTASVATAFRVQSKGWQKNLKQRLEDVSHQIQESSRGRYQMTMTALDIDAKTGKFTFYSAGGMPLLIQRGDARPQLVTCLGTPLGDESLTIGEIELELGPGDRILMFTDGIPETRTMKRREFGVSNMMRMFQQTRGLKLELAAQEIVREVDDKRGIHPQSDDWTLVLIEKA